ncbi:hypothetical protein BOTBODRAFT_348581 [Botryobasidium botryosum FD-172 SS1]|uniref:Uncharacterized protein n=1 Tax=Botryobasidium botryosum (strain FD-172 SS1) TaxID=930990 RepID=A0A067MRY4_BOTB1|nr:hypothetical protein BOTBODRAFT_348581 [Botryobasidium botryosum FD-172 SS1]
MAMPLACCVTLPSPETSTTHSPPVVHEGSMSEKTKGEVERPSSNAVHSLLTVRARTSLLTLVGGPCIAIRARTAIRGACALLFRK